MATRDMRDVKCNTKLELRAIQLQPLHTTNETLKHHMEKFTW